MKKLKKKIFENKKILTVLNDVGAAKVIFEFLKKKKISSNFFLTGPSKKLIKKYSNNQFSLHKNLRDYNLIITGTSMKSKNEIKFIKKAKKLNITTITFLDHWTGYKERFFYNNKYYFPDLIIVGDYDAYKIAKKEFKKKTEIVYQKNYYLSVKKNKLYKSNLSFASSNLDRLKNKKLKDNIIFIKFMKIINKKNNYNIRRIFLKPHPSENGKKFNNLIKRLKNEYTYKFKIISDDNTFFHSKYVAGFDSMALVKAKHYGCKTINIRSKNYKNMIPKKYIEFTINI